MNKVKDSIGHTWRILMCCMALAFTPLANADMAPEFTLPTMKGDISLVEQRGHVVLVDFWASWCGPCRESFSWMNQMLNKYGKQGFRIIAINLDQERAEADAFLRQNQADFTIAFDDEGATPEQWKVMGMPSSFLLNEKGEVVAQHIGFHKSKLEAYEAHIKQALGSK